MAPDLGAAQRREQLDERRGQLRAGACPAALDKFERAAAALEDYLHELELGDDGPMAGSLLSPNVLRSVRLPDGQPAVLKLVGEPVIGETATLAAWTAAGVACVPLLDHGIGRCAADVTHLLTLRVAGEPMPHVAMAGATADIVEVLASAHLLAPHGVSTLAETLGPRLATAADVWDSAGWSAPKSLRTQLSDLGHATLLHGDPVGMNLLVHDGAISLLDPAGVCGPAEFDAGRWIGRSLATAGTPALDGLIATALSADPGLRADVLAMCVAVELVIEVRHRLTSPEVYLGIGAPKLTFDDDTAALAAAASRLARC